MKTGFCCGSLRSAVTLEFLAMLFLCPITVFAKFPTYDCQPYKNDPSFSVCGNIGNSRREYKFGCDVFCFFGAEWNGTALILRKTTMISNFHRWRVITTPRKTDPPTRLVYSSFAYVMAVFTPACLRETLMMFYDIVTKDPAKGTSLAYMEEADIEFWFSHIVVGSIFKYLPEPTSVYTDVLHVDRWNAYWTRMLISFINEEVDCS